MNHHDRRDSAAFSEEDPPIESLPPQVGIGPIGQGALAAGVSLLSAAYPPSAVVLAGVGAFLPALGQKLSQIQDAKTAELLVGATTASSLPIDDVVQQLVERDDIALLSAEATDAARRTRLQGKPSALGWSLGTILADDARIDEESIWIRLMKTVEPPHVRLLRVLMEPGRTPEGWGYEVPQTLDVLGRRLGIGEAVTPLVQDLVLCGCVATAGIDGGSVHGSGPLDQRYQTTGLARQLLKRLRRRELSN